MVIQEGWRIRPKRVKRYTIQMQRMENKRENPVWVNGNGTGKCP
jgi:hypothetical protein